jgi:hypothetical protein
MSAEATTDIDVNICFLCNEENFDMTSEIKSLEEPMSEVEATFILERCSVIDHDMWENVLGGATASHPASTDGADEQLSQNAADVTISEPILKLEVCHICG